jgi:hypothetical protein
MLDVWAAVAVLPAPPEFGVERVEEIAVERPDLHRADERSDVLVGVAGVGGERVSSSVQLEMAIEELDDRCVSPRLAVLVDLAGQPAHDLFGFCRRLRPSRHGLL